MFESLQERLSDVFGKLTRKGALREGDVDAALREVRISGVFQTRNRENIGRLLAQGWGIESREIAPDEILLTRQ